jgi:hypothetical protein
MSHAHQPSHRPASHGMGMKHALKLFLLNAVLYGACAAFAGVIVGDYLPVEAQGKVLLAFVVGPFVLAIISTVAHMKAHAWTSVDDMAERFAHPHQRDDRGGR